jgi:hypothetical protein
MIIAEFLGLTIKAINCLLPYRYRLELVLSNNKTLGITLNAGYLEFLLTTNFDHYINYTINKALLVGSNLCLSLCNGQQTTVLTIEEVTIYDIQHWEV